MPEMMIFDEKKKEDDYLADKAKDVNAYISDTKLEVSQFTDKDEAVDAVISEGAADDYMAVAAVPDDGNTEAAEHIRSVNQNAGIMIVADETLSPRRYLTPKIKATSLLLRPYSDYECRTVMKEFMHDCYEKNEKLQKRITVGSRREKIALAVSEIYYIEARGKKVFFVLRDREVSEYASFEKVLHALGDGFERCHRSFAFNMKYFAGVNLADNQVRLLHDMTIPLSRTYKSAMRDLVSRLGEHDEQ